MAPPPVINIPPPANKKESGQQAVFKQYINAHPTMRGYAGAIYKAANDYGVDPVYYASLLWKESFAAAKAQGKDPATIESPTGAGVGVAQINPKVHIGESVPWAPGTRITRADLDNPAFSIRWGAYYFAQGLAKTGSYETAYKQYYNPGYTGSVFQDVPGSYVPTTTASSPTDVVTRGAETGAAKVALFDKWAVLGADGRVKFVKISDAGAPPKNVLHYGPTPLTQTQFLQTWKQNYQDTFFSYTGRQASGKEIANILTNAPSLYTLANTLAQTKSFTTSPTYKAHAPGIVAIAKQLYGETWKVDKTLVAHAISQNWDQATLEENLKSRPEYFQGPQFADDKAKMDNVYQQVYGASTDPATQTVIDHVARDGWTTDQFAAWLRTQPQYTSSQEFKTKAISFAQQLGLITGKQVSLTADQAMLGPAPSVPGPAPAAGTGRSTPGAGAGLGGAYAPAAQGG